MTASAKGFHTAGGVGAVFEGVCILGGKRTPFGKFMGGLSTVSPTDLGIIASRAVLKETGVPASDVDQVVVANIGQASADAFFLPRHIGLYAGAPLETPAVLVQRICGSGIEVIGQAAEQIALGKAKLVLGCGTDTMSRFPLVSFGARQGFNLGKPEFLDMLWEALDDTAAVPMGATADNVAKKYSLTRAEVDVFAMRSQERYAAAMKRGFFNGEITPVAKGVIEQAGLKPRKVRINAANDIMQDEHPRQTSLEKLATLPCVFSKDGPSTAGNASGIVDGACSVLIASEDYAKAKGMKPIGKIRAVASVGVAPDIMGIGPVPAIEAVLKALNLTKNDIDCFEINEAFGAQCLGVARALGLDENKLNINGGAVAIGHPLGATGLRLVTTVLRSLKETGGKLGVASACIGGGQGIAMVVERI